MQPGRRASRSAKEPGGSVGVADAMTRARRWAGQEGDGRAAAAVRGVRRGSIFLRGGRRRGRLRADTDRQRGALSAVCVCGEAGAGKGGRGVSEERECEGELRVLVPHPTLGRRA
jgi:hypothetical protein